jgi:hypothetical protein
MNLEKHELKEPDQGVPGHQSAMNIVGHNIYFRELEEEDVDLVTREEDDDLLFARSLAMEDYDPREDVGGVSLLSFL